MRIKILLALSLINLGKQLTLISKVVFGLSSVIFGGKVQHAFSSRRKLSIRVKVNKYLWNLTKYAVKVMVLKKASSRYCLLLGYSI